MKLVFSYSIIVLLILKNILNKNERRCRDAKTQKVCEQGQDGINTGG